MESRQCELTPITLAVAVAQLGYCCVPVASTLGGASGAAAII
jgi:hypothetical protein